jgi:hypothetical protein
MYNDAILPPSNIAARTIVYHDAIMPPVLVCNTMQYCAFTAVETEVSDVISDIF